MSRYDTRNRKHEQHGEKLYRIYKNIKSICYRETDPAYPNHGGKGIILDELWLDDFSEFYDWAISLGYDYGDKLMRFNENLNFDPKNCYWKKLNNNEVLIEQQNNKNELTKEHHEMIETINSLLEKYYKERNNFDGNYFLNNDKWEIDYFENIERFKKDCLSYKKQHNVCKNLNFLSKSNKVNIELKYLFFYKIFTDQWNFRTAFNLYRQKMIVMTKFLDECGYNSMLDVDIEEVKEKWKIWLNSQKDRKSQIISFIITVHKTINSRNYNSIHLRFVDFWDKKVYEDWNVNSKVNGKIYFNEIKNDSFKECLMSYLENRIKNENNFSIREASLYANYLTQFFNFISNNYPSNDSPAKITKEIVSEYFKQNKSSITTRHIRSIKKVCISLSIDISNDSIANIFFEKINHKTNNPILDDFGKLLEDYLEHKINKDNVEISTIEHYRYTVFLFLNYLVENYSDVKTLKDINFEHLTSFKDNGYDDKNEKRIVVIKAFLDHYSVNLVEESSTIENNTCNSHHNNSIETETYIISDFIIKQFLYHKEKLNNDVKTIIDICLNTGFEIENILKMNRKCLISTIEGSFLMLNSETLPITNDVKDLIFSISTKKLSLKQIEQELNKLSYEYNIVDRNGNVYYISTKHIRYIYAKKFISENKEKIYPIKDLICELIAFKSIID